MATSAEAIRAYRGPAILSYGFRPLFLLAGLWAALTMVIWSAALAAGLSLPTAYGMLDWHVHELLFGYVPAVVAGFLLTAVPNWTGRLPVVGTPLLMLVLVWLAGRAAMLLSAAINPWVAAAIDMGFLAVLIAVIAREILAGGNWRNLKVLVLVGPRGYATVMGRLAAPSLVMQALAPIGAAELLSEGAAGGDLLLWILAGSAALNLLIALALLRTGQRPAVAS